MKIFLILWLNIGFANFAYAGNDDLLEDAIQRGEWIQQGIAVTLPSVDLAIAGKGFFVLTDGTQKIYSRYGAFYLDKFGAVRQRGSDLQLMYFNEGNLIPAKVYLSRQFKKHLFPSIQETETNPQIKTKAKRAVATLSKIKADVDGKMWFHYSDKLFYGTGTIAIANFESPRKLKRQGMHSLLATEESGESRIFPADTLKNVSIHESALEVLDENAYEMNLSE